MVRFQAKVNGKVVGEGNTMQEAVAAAEGQGYSVAEIHIRSVRETPKI